MNINNNKIAILCSTKTLSDMVLKELYNQEFTGCQSIDNYNIDKESVCYVVEDGKIFYDSVEIFEDEGFKIIDANEFLKIKESQTDLLKINERINEIILINNSDEKLITDLNQVLNDFNNRLSVKI